MILNANDIAVLVSNAHNGRVAAVAIKDNKVELDFTGVCYGHQSSLPVSTPVNEVEEVKTEPTPVKSRVTEKEVEPEAPETDSEETSEEEAPKPKKRRKRRTKAEMEAARKAEEAEQAEEEDDSDDEPEEEEQPKRKRRSFGKRSAKDDDDSDEEPSTLVIDSFVTPEE